MLGRERVLRSCRVLNRAWTDRLGAGLLREPGFRRFWTAQVVSELGSGVSSVALPLTAVLWLGASAMEMGVLRAAATLPVLLFALHAGVWVDRLPRRPIMVAADAGRGLLLLLVPLAAAAGLLRIDVLWAVAFVVGVLTVVFDIAVTSYVPTLVGRAALVEANATLQASSAAARIVGPGAAGWLVQLVGAPAALLADAASFVASAALLWRLRVPEAAPGARRGVGAEIAEGLGAVWHDPLLRAMVLVTTVGSLGGSVQAAVYVLYATRYVGASPAALGAVLACGSAAGLAGAALAGPAAARLGTGGALVASTAVVAASTVALLAAPAGDAGVLVLAGAQALFGLGLTTYSVTQISLRQAVTPPHLLGRVNATRRVVVFGVQPLGALLGGALGETLGLHAALTAAAAIQVVSLVAAFASPLRALSDAAPAGRAGDASAG
jgi:MFS family permease